MFNQMFVQVEMFLFQTKDRGRNLSLILATREKKTDQYTNKKTNNKPMREQTKKQEARRK